MEVLPEPSGKAELHIIVKQDESPDVPEGNVDWTASPMLRWLRWLVPSTAEVWVTVPGTEADRLLRMLERITVAVTWPATVIGTLFGAAAAHLPPAGTITVVVLEIAAPPVMLRARRGSVDK
jgi:hypothetical protein